MKGQRYRVCRSDIRMGLAEWSFTFCKAGNGESFGSSSVLTTRKHGQGEDSTSGDLDRQVCGMSVNQANACVEMFDTLMICHVLVSPPNIDIASGHASDPFR